MVDYTPYLQVTEHGQIWWRLEDAARLGAGFQPSPVADSCSAPRLVTSSQQEPEIVSKLLVAIRKNVGSLESPPVVKRGNEVVIAAEEFLSWLAEYILESGTVIEFPSELTRAVAAKQAVHLGQVPFQSLKTVLEDFFEQPFMSLPSTLQALIRDHMDMVPWDRLSVDQRRSYADQCDLKNDPARIGEHAF